MGKLRKGLAKELNEMKSIDKKEDIMINVVVKKDHVTDKSDYPCLKIANTGRIVLFTGIKTGYQLVGDDYYGFLYYATDWCEGEFEPYTGTLELSNNMT